VQNTDRAGAELWSVGITLDGKKLYVTDINSNSVAVLDAATGQTLTTVTVGSLSVISTATDTLAATVPGTTAFDSARTDILFAPAG
jgi:YVTN family beta-propeller protein